MPFPGRCLAGRESRCWIRLFFALFLTLLLFFLYPSFYFLFYLLPFFSLSFFTLPCCWTSTASREGSFSFIFLLLLLPFTLFLPFLLPVFNPFFLFRISCLSLRIGNVSRGFTFPSELDTDKAGLKTFHSLIY